MRISDWSSDVCSSDLLGCTPKDREIAESSSGAFVVHVCLSGFRSLLALQGELPDRGGLGIRGRAIGEPPYPACRTMERLARGCRRDPSHFPVTIAGRRHTI